MVENVVVVRDLLDRVTRLLLTMPVLLWQWHTGDVSTSAESPCHVLRVARAARVGGHLCAVVLAGPDLHGLAGFPLVPDLKCFRWSLEWLSSKLAVRRCLLNPVLPLPMPSAPP